MKSVCVEVKDLEKRYGETKAVDGISFKVFKGSIFGMLGPNGAGKSTTIETIIGLQTRDNGSVGILGMDPERDLVAIKEKVGVQLQSPSLFGKLKVKELVSLFASFYKNPYPVREVIEMVSLGEKENTSTESLSGGQRHRLAVALAIVGNGEIIFLDEPTTGLDPKSRRDLWDVIKSLKKRGKTIFLTTHYMDEAEKLCDELLIIDRGKVIAEGSPKNLIAEYFHEDALEFVNPSFTREEIAVLSGFSQVTRQSFGEDDRIILYTKKASSTMDELMEYARGLDKTIDGLSVRRPTLEDLFLKLTGRKIKG